ncbi:HAD-like domain-containing protein [Umbelopsis sp. AD052]|nr:HAD-like domain-containing protein [Umbelopsis sp. AD052]
MARSEELMFFFDLDNCLYHKSHGIQNLMRKYILQYFDKLGIPESEAAVLRERYYIEYGLSIRGMIQHHQVDPVDFDEQVDGRLPLEDLLKPEPELRKMLETLPMRKWILTNAGLQHAKRVLKLLDIEDQFEGITYCNYSEPNFPCKPEVTMYERAMKDAGVKEHNHCYFVDDSDVNVEAATKLGWTSVHVADDPKKSNAGDFQIAAITELPQVLPDLWKQ